MEGLEQLDDEVYVVKEVASFLKISASSVYYLIGRKQIKYFRLGGAKEGVAKGDYRITRQSLLDFIARRENEEKDN